MPVTDLPRRNAPASASPEGEPVISVRGLRKSYGEREVVRGIDLEIHAGEIFAFLGTQRRRQDRHRGDPRGISHANWRRGDRARRGPAGRRPRLAIQGRGGPAELHDAGRAHRLGPLELYASYYPRPRPVGDDRARRPRGRPGFASDRLSGGQQRRLDVALALIGDPELVFLDEPTTGFDPAARHHAWDVISNLRDLGKTVFLTTHYMEEAQALADRLAVISAGRIVSEGTPETLWAAATRPRATSPSHRRSGSMSALLPARAPRQGRGAGRAPAPSERASGAGAARARGLGTGAWLRADGPDRGQADAGGRLTCG